MEFASNSHLWYGELHGLWCPAETPNNYILPFWRPKTNTIPICGKSNAWKGPTYTVKVNMHSKAMQMAPNQPYLAHLVFNKTRFLFVENQTYKLNPNLPWTMYAQHVTAPICDVWCAPTGPPDPQINRNPYIQTSYNCYTSDNSEFALKQCKQAWITYIWPIWTPK